MSDMMNLMTAQGVEHGIIKRVANSVQDNNFKYCKPSDKEKLKKLRQEENQIVKARLINLKGSTKPLEFPYCRWPGDPIDTWRLLVGEVYDVPKGLIDQVNDPLNVPPQRSGLLDANSCPLPSDEKGVPDYQLIPISF